MWWRGREEEGEFVPLSVEDALAQATIYLTRKGASVTGGAGNSVSFSYRQEASCAIALILLLLGILPGLLYLLLAGRHVSFTITATPLPGGSRMIFGGEYGAGYIEFRRWVRQVQR